MEAMLVLDELSFCKNKEEVIDVLDRKLGKKAGLGQRIFALHAYLGITGSSACGEPLSQEKEFELTVIHLLDTNKDEGNI